MACKNTGIGGNAQMAFRVKPGENGKMRCAEDAIGKNSI